MLRLAGLLVKLAFWWFLVICAVRASARIIWASGHAGRMYGVVVRWDVEQGRKEGSVQPLINPGYLQLLLWNRTWAIEDVIKLPLYGVFAEA